MHQVSKKTIKALALASNAHRYQKRKGDGSPYINHLIEVTTILNITGFNDENLIASALLHDCIEDTRVTYNDLVNELGLEVADTVLALTDDKTLPISKRRKAQLQTAQAADKNVRLIKLADAISNARLLLPSWSLEWAESSLNHLTNLGNICKKESPQLNEMLQETVRKSLQEHEYFVNYIRPGIERWLTENKVYYSFRRDTFYCIRDDVDASVNTAILAGKYDTYLRAMRSKRLMMSLGDSAKLLVNGKLNDERIINISEPFYEPVSLIALRPVQTS